MAYTVIFFASSEIALPLLKAVAADSRFKILALICQPDKEAGREGELKKPITIHVAEYLGLRILQPDKLSLDMALLRKYVKIHRIFSSLSLMVNSFRNRGLNFQKSLP